NDAILIIEGEPGRAVNSPLSRLAASTPKRAAKGRPQAKTTQRPAEPPTPRHLSVPRSTPISSAISHPPGLKPLTLPHAATRAPGPNESASEAPTRAQLTDASPLDAGDVRRILGTPTGLREGLLVSEVVFRPPLSLRGGLIVRRRKG